jgi:hypothetical protein
VEGRDDELPQPTPPAAALECLEQLDDPGDRDQPAEEKNAGQRQEFLSGEG